MPRQRGDIIEVVESAYRVRENACEWLRAVAADAGPHLFSSRGGVACLYDRGVGNPRDILSSFVEVDIDPRVAAALRANFETSSQEDRERTLGGGPIVRLTDVVGGPVAASPHFAWLTRELDIADLIGVHAANPDGTGAFFGVAVARAQGDTARWDVRWARIGAHLSAGLRLQRAATRLAADGGVADAVLSPDGKVLHASDEAAPLRESLRRAALAIDRARGPLRREDCDGALDAWTALVEGRWSLVDHFESDGKRYLLALPNTPDAPDPRALTVEERPIVQYVMLGHTNKLIGYELGIPEGTVATRLSTAMRKLGVRSRAQLVNRVRLLRRAQMTPCPIDDLQGLTLVVDVEALPACALLTAAENQVCALAARGLDNAGIARTRRCAVRTVANLLASAYRKLGISSRAQLGEALARSKKMTMAS